MENYAPAQNGGRKPGCNPMISALLIAVFVGVAFVMIAGMFYKRPGEIKIPGKEAAEAASTDEENTKAAPSRQQNRPQGQRRAERPLPDISIFGNQPKPSVPLDNRND